MKMKNKTTKLRTHTFLKKVANSEKKNPQFCFLIIRNLYPKKNHNSLLCGQIYPLSLPPGGKVDISARSAGVQLLIEMVWIVV